MRTFCWVIALIILTAQGALAQADVLTGRVVGTDGVPVPGARVTATSIETEATRSVLTDKNGRYLISFPDGGGRYLLRIQMLGMADVVQTVFREGEELLLSNIVLRPAAIRLDTLQINAQRATPGRGQTGERSTDLSQDLLNRLPLPDLDPATLALMAAGVTGVGNDSLSGRPGFSVGGMNRMLNQSLLDGMIMGRGNVAVPEEGMRRTQITTNSFDVSRGGFAGGQIAMTSARGNNRAAGSLAYRLDEDALQWRSTPLAYTFTRHNLGGAMGGPLLRDRLFYNGAFQVGRTDNHRFALAADDPYADQRTGVRSDSIARFLDILAGRHGLATGGQTGPFDQVGEDIRLQARADWNLTQRQSQAHSLTARVNINRNNQDSVRISTFDLAQHGGESTSNSSVYALTLNSRLGGSWTNSLNLGFSEYWDDALPYLVLPEGIVRITSDFADGTRGTQSLQFGGNRNLPVRAYSKDRQISNDLSFVLPLGAQLHRLKVGGLLQFYRTDDRSTENLLGAFSFASLADFERNRPDRFERTLAEQFVTTDAVYGGVYLGDTWRLSQPFELTFGLRWDYSALRQAPARNPAIEQRFGRRTDITPDATGWSPRLGFNYRISGQSASPRSISGGIGWFAGQTPTDIFATAFRQTGLPDADRRLVCIGAATPLPEWNRYARDPSSIPARCLETTSGSAASLSPAVTLINPDRGLPSSVRLDLGYRTQLPFRMQGEFHYSYSAGLNLWGYRDLNLAEARSFVLAGEGRPFFGTPADIFAATGATTLAGSRSDAAFGQVLDVVADRKSHAHQFIATFNGLLFGRAVVFGNYMLSFARDQGSGPFAQATTGGNPNAAEWSTSSDDRRHTLNLSTQLALSSTLEVALTARLSSGAPFTPLVSRDINGDGARNDRAFIFDPAAEPDSAVSTGMQRLLGLLPSRVAGCLQQQLGRIAQRNSCRDSWTQSIDLRASYRPNLPLFERRFTLSLDTRNLLSGLDRLVHGADALRGWGEGQRADNNLLDVRSFDRAANRFAYSVNEGFGQARRGANAFRNAMSLRITGRLAIGGQAMMNNRGFGVMSQVAFGEVQGNAPDVGAMMQNMMASGMPGLGMIMQSLGDFDPATITLELLAERFLSNPITALSNSRDSLGLNARQQADIKAIEARLEVQLLQRRTALREAEKKVDLKALMRAAPSQMSAGGVRTPVDPALMQAFQLNAVPPIMGGQREIAAALDSARAIIGPLWQKVPAQVRNAAQLYQQLGGAGTANFKGFVDRMLANPIPVLLSFRDTVQMTSEQVSRIEELSAVIDTMLVARRAEFERLLRALAQAQGMAFQQFQPQIEAARREVSKTLAEIERILTREQWLRLPERVRNPYANAGMPRAP